MCVHAFAAFGPIAPLRGSWIRLPDSAVHVGPPLPVAAHLGRGVTFRRGRFDSPRVFTTGVPLICGIVAAASFRRAHDRFRQVLRPSRRKTVKGVIAMAATGAAAVWEPGSQDERTCSSEQEYLERLSGPAALPKGFRVGTTKFTFQPVEVADKTLPMNLSLISLDEPTDMYAAVFTQNAFPGSPILVGRRRLAARKPLQAVVVNNKISNVFPGGDGEAASEEVCAGAAKAMQLGGGAESVLPASTGIIGWRLPTADMLEAMPDAVASLQADTALPLARGIMTTDRYAKLSGVELPGGAKIVGVAKGAGMIEPNMATMLCFIMTDADLPCSPAELQSMLSEVVMDSFNVISVDGDESTSDTVALLSSKRVPCPDVKGFAQALDQVCRELAAEVVRNGEGTQHVIRVAVSGAVDDATARRVGRAVVNGPLFKSAVAGNDPNVGRLVGKVGQALSKAGAAMADGCVCTIGGETIFEGGKFSLDSEKESRLSAHLKAAYQDSELTYPAHGRVVDVGVRLGGGGVGKAVVLGSDLTREYVSINADYRS